MSSAEAAAPRDDRPSVFLSYASEDRPAVRKLRDALQAAGVDAWYDENELTGGDAWDAKIRRQIRECTYFMPVISAKASGRLEGYFRREWRFALERMLDMADDVVFLLPIVIDDSQETTARVPEKFLAVQWMRVPGGDATKAFNELARRLAAGGAQRLHQAPASRPVEKSGGTRPPQYLPPIDAGPPEGIWAKLKYFWKKLPRWARIVGWIFFFLVAMDACSRCTNGDAAPASRKSKTQADQKARIEAQVANALKSTGAAAKRSTDVVLLAGAAKNAATSVASDLYGKLVLAKGVKSRYDALPLKEGETTLARAAALGATYVLTCVQTETDDGRPIIRGKLEQTGDGAVVWTQDFPADLEPAVISAQAHAQVLPLLLKKD